jgi:hypothetical protein
MWQNDFSLVNTSLFLLKQGQYFTISSMYVHFSHREIEYNRKLCFLSLSDCYLYDQPARPVLL